MPANFHMHAPMQIVPENGDDVREMMPEDVDDDENEQDYRLADSMLDAEV